MNLSRLIGLTMITFVFSVAGASAGEVSEKCVEVMTSIGAANVEEGCACFETEAAGDLAAEYLAIDVDKWNENASEDLKKAASICFPEDNTNE